MGYSRQRQSGSVVVYTIVSVLLAAMVIGAIIVAKNRASQQITTPPSEEVATQESEEQSTEDSKETAQDADKGQEDTDKEAEETAAREKAQEEAKKLAEERAAAEQEAAATQDQDETQVNSDGPMARTGGAQGSALPTTGPVEDLLGMVTGLLVIVGAGYLYYHYGQRR